MIQSKSRQANRKIGRTKWSRQKIKRNIGKYYIPANTEENYREQIQGDKIRFYNLHIEKIKERLEAVIGAGLNF